MARLYVGLCGKPLAGKGTFAEQLSSVAADCRLTFAHVRFSDLLREMADLLALDQSRSNLQKIAQMIDEKFGQGTFSNAVLARLLKYPADVVLVDGVRWLTDEEMIRKLPGNRMVYIASPIEDRYERSKKRGENVGEKEKLFEQFCVEDEAENERFVENIGARADVKIQNAGTSPESEASYRKRARREAEVLIECALLETTMPPS